MVEANVKIIEELKCFLNIVSTDPQIRQLVTQCPSDFSRDRKLKFELVVGIILNMPKRSLSIEIQEFFDSLENGLSPATKGAFSLQRTKLQSLFFEVWNKWLVGSFYHYYGSKVKSWRGFLLQAVDGSTAYLINTEEVAEHYGTQDNQHGSVPMARVMQLQDVLNDITLWGAIGPITESEQTIMAREVSNLHPDSLTLFDRGYPGYTLMYLIINQETPRHFVMRCKAGFNREVIQFGRSPKSSKIVELTPTKEAIANLRTHGYIVTDKTTIKVRMVKVRLSSGEIEILLTNLYDHKLFTTEDLKYLYGLRWGIETTYSKQKNQLQMEQFSGHRVICIQQDYAASLFVANLQSLIEKQCEHYLKQINKRRKYCYKINRNVSWASMKHTMIRLFLYNEPEQILLKLQKAFERNIEPVRPGRQFPRIIKSKRTKGKYQTFTNYKRAI
ncbi:MAG: IS4 family transposase [Chitinophagales bacterium]